MFSCIDAQGKGKAPELGKNLAWGIVFVVFIVSAAFVATNMFLVALVEAFSFVHAEMTGTAFLTEWEKISLRIKHGVDKVLHRHLLFCI